MIEIWNITRFYHHCQARIIHYFDQDQMHNYNNLQLQHTIYGTKILHEIYNFIYA